MVPPFVQRFREKYGLSPDLYAAHGYDSLMVLAASLPYVVRPGRAAARLFRGAMQLFLVAFYVLLAGLPILGGVR